MTARWHMAALVAATVGTLAPAAQAADAHGIAEKHHLFVTADRLVPLLAYERTSTTFPTGNSIVTQSESRTSTVLMLSSPLDRKTFHTLPRVAFDFTVIPRLTLGGFVAVGLGVAGSDDREVVTGSNVNETTEDTGSGTVFGVGPRVGYILPLGDVLALWLRGGFSFYSLSARNYDDDDNRIRLSTTRTSASLDVDPQLTIVPLEHFYLGVGPLLNIPVAGSQRVERTVGNNASSSSNDFSQFHLGINASLGGWFSL